ncbi:MAG: agmatine deiminase family protein [Bacteroidales bacterium]|nr:agmatine deiminase family protein [Bacteroidales bacterium]
MRLPAEWEKQGFVQLTWPHRDSLWYEVEKVQECYTRIAEAILRYEPLVIVGRSESECREDLARCASHLGLSLDIDSIRFAECGINDTWARDHGGISVLGNKKYVLDFVFNGWGLKFASDLDNQITRKMFREGVFASDVMLVEMRPYVLEGGSIDTDGQGTLLTTTECLTSLNRNEYLNKEEIERILSKAFGLKRILWLDYGSIAGDDTDSHVDILARFCSPDTIAYTACNDPADENYDSLKAMEDQLKSFRTLDGKPYKLVPLPLPDPMYLDDYRLPGSYSNFLIINGAVLVPGTGSSKDDIVKETLRKVFSERNIEVIDCRPLLSGHGGLHCITMNYPEGYLA